MSSGGEDDEFDDDTDTGDLLCPYCQELGCDGWCSEEDFNDKE